jgi:hypothetical protein
MRTPAIALVSIFAFIGTALKPGIGWTQTASEISVSDTRSVNSPPTAYGQVVKFDFKNSATVNSPTTSGYVGLMTFAPWASGDITGEKLHQLGFAQDGLFWRTGVANASNWDPWTRLITGTTDNHIQMLPGKELRFPSAGGGFNRISSSGIPTDIFGSWIFKSRFDHIVLDAGENTSNLRKILLRTGGADRMVVDEYGNAGVGTNYPHGRLHVMDAPYWSSSNYGASLIIDGPHNNAIGIFDSNSANPLALANTAGTLTIAKMPALGDVSSSPQPLMVVQPNGNVGIGTTAPGSFKLAVNGKIWTQEVNVQMNNPGPDYVFEKDYNLLPLKEVEHYIAQNKHLPEVPSAKDMESDGLNLKEMNLILLKKVEELTLHLIDATKKIEALQQDKIATDTKLKELESKIKP